MQKKFLPTFYPKGWGKEIWIFNSDEYCGKILEFNIGKRCSWHYHLIKDEVFYLKKGKIEVIFSKNDEIAKGEKITLEVGECFHVPPGLRHQMIALEDSELFEISTTHNEDDTIRVIKGD
jgi:mannose-6-phosphate isomerase-like protein (cupin superfamily)